jgi:hypothetical protein
MTAGVSNHQWQRRGKERKQRDGVRRRLAAMATGEGMKALGRMKDRRREWWRTIVVRDLRSLEYCTWSRC